MVSTTSQVVRTEIVTAIAAPEDATRAEINGQIRYIGDQPERKEKLRCSITDSSVYCLMITKVWKV